LRQIARDKMAAHRTAVSVPESCETNGQETIGRWTNRQSIVVKCRFLFFNRVNLFEIMISLLIIFVKFF